MSILNSIIQAEADAKNLINEAKNDEKVIIETQRKHAEAEAAKILDASKEEASKISAETKETIKVNKVKNEKELKEIEQMILKGSESKIDELVDFVVEKVLER